MVNALRGIENKNNKGRHIGHVFSELGVHLSISVKITKM